MIFGAKEEIIPKYYDDDKPKSVQKTPFGLVRIRLLWLRQATKKKSVLCAFFSYKMIWFFDFIIVYNQ